MYLTPEENRALYDCIRNALVEHQPDRLSHFPPTQIAEKARAFDVTGGKADMRTCDISEMFIEDWSTTLADHINQTAILGKSSFYYIQIQNLKISALHATLEPQSEDEDQLQFEERESWWDEEEEIPALGRITEGLDYDWEEMTSSNCQFYLDVALELSVPGETTQWYRPSHQSLISYILQINPQHAIGITKRPHFKIDTTAGISDCAGFHTGIHQRDSDLGVAYIQAYCTDKTPTYNASKPTHSNELPGQALIDLLKLGKWDDISRAGSWFAGMNEIYNSCISKGQTGNARLEIRLPIAQARGAFATGLPIALLEQTLLHFPAKLLWFVFIWLK